MREGRGGGEKTMKMKDSKSGYERTEKDFWEGVWSTHSVMGRDGGLGVANEDLSIKDVDESVVRERNLVWDMETRINELHKERDKVNIQEINRKGQEEKDYVLVED